MLLKGIPKYKYIAGFANFSARLYFHSILTYSPASCPVHYYNGEITWCNLTIRYVYNNFRV